MLIYARLNRAWKYPSKWFGRVTKGENMTLSTILIILLVLALVGAVPVWGYNRSWGYAPGGVVGLILVILLILALTGGLNW